MSSPDSVCPDALAFHSQKRYLRNPRSKQMGNKLNKTVPHDKKGALGPDAPERRVHAAALTGEIPPSAEAGKVAAATSVEARPDPYEFTRQLLASHKVIMDHLAK